MLVAMSRAFVKNDNGEQPGDELPERPQSPHPNYVTPGGLAALQAQLGDLQEHRRRLVEEPENLLNKETLKLVERDLRYVQGRLDHAIPVDPATQPADQGSFGAGGKIVGEDEADAAAGKVSWVSPLARALMGAGVGDSATWKRPAGDLQLEILSIRYTR